jgi:hypothetical protein
MQTAAAGEVDVTRALFLVFGSIRPMIQIGPKRRKAWRACSFSGLVVVTEPSSVGSFFFSFSSLKCEFGIS